MTIQIKQILLQVYHSLYWIIPSSLFIGVSLAVLRNFRKCILGSEQVFMFNLRREEIEDWYIKHDQRRIYVGKRHWLRRSFFFKKNLCNQYLVQQIIGSNGSTIMEREVMFVTIEENLQLLLLEGDGIMFQKI